MFCKLDTVGTRIFRSGSKACNIYFSLLEKLVSCKEFLKVLFDLCCSFWKLCWCVSIVTEVKMIALLLLFAILLLRTLWASRTIMIWNLSKIFASFCQVAFFSQGKAAENWKKTGESRKKMRQYLRVYEWLQTCIPNIGWRNNPLSRYSHGTWLSKFLF